MAQKWLLLHPQASNRLQTLHHGSPISLLQPSEANNQKTCKLPVVKENLSQNSSKLIMTCIKDMVLLLIVIMFSCRNYNASKYGSSCGNTLGDFLKNATSRTNTSSSGSSSTETNLCHHDKNRQPAASDLSNHSFSKHSSAEVNKSGHKETRGLAGDYRRHRRRGSDSVTKDSGLDFSHVQENSSGGLKATQTSSEQQKRNCKNKSEATRSKSLGDIVEPLNSLRLRPMRQKTRNAVVSITDDGEVCLEFFHHENGQDRVFEVVQISQNGMKISVYQPNGESGIPLSLQPPLPPAGGESTSTYLFSNLPSKYWKKYQYATQFVHLVRKKTPKVRMTVLLSLYQQ